MTKEDRILIADDHGIVRLGVTLLIKELRPHALIEEVEDYQGLVAVIKQKKFDLVILDINMPNGTFKETVDIIRHIQPQLKILILSSQDEQIYALRYLKMGANGFLHKLAPKQEMKKALEKMLDSGKYISEGIKENIVLDSINNHKSAQNPFETLSDREMEIADKLVKGLGLKEIAVQLNLHTSTVSTYKIRILQKLEVQSVAEIIELFRMYNNLIK